MTDTTAYAKGLNKVGCSGPVAGVKEIDPSRDFAEIIRQQVGMSGPHQPPQQSQISTREKPPFSIAAE